MQSKIEIMARGRSQKSEIRYELKNSSRRENREFLHLTNLSWRNTPLKARQEDFQKSTVIPFGNRWQTLVTHAGLQIHSTYSSARKWAFLNKKSILWIITFPQALISKDDSRKPTSGCIALNTGISISVIWLWNEERILHRVIWRANNDVFLSALQ